MNERRKIKIKSFLLTAVFLVILLRTCSIMEPPKIAEVEIVFQLNRDDIQIVVDFMISSEYKTIRIDAEGSTGLKSTDGYHFETQEIILDQKTQEAANRLLSGKYKTISKSENTITLHQWNWFNDVSCGAAFTINSQDLPGVPYVTKLIPMKQEGWYYYVADFNQWRLEQK